MSREIPDWVNPWKAAEGNRVYRGSIALGSMSRLKPLLAVAEGEAKFEAAFTRHEKGLVTLELHVDADLPLRCEASLEQYLHPVNRKSFLAVVEDEAGPDTAGDYETTGIESGQLVFLDVVQDELILEVPQIPRKPGLKRVRYSTDPDDEDNSSAGRAGMPFAELGALLPDERKETDTD